MTDQTTRRDFLRTAAAVTAMGTFFPTEELLADPRPVPSAAPLPPLGPQDPVNLGVIGTGGMGTGHMEALVNAAKAGRANLRVVALSDVCQPRMMDARMKAEAVQGQSTVELYGDYRALLSRPDVHGVVIASPEHWHGQMAEDAILSGKDVYVEKPMTLRLKEALRLMDVVDTNPKVRCNVGTQYVMIPSYNEAKALIARGAIGKPVWSQTSYCRNSKEGEWLYYAIDPRWQEGVTLDWDAWCGPLGEAPYSAEVYARWRRYRKYSTGIIGDLLVHRITPLIMAMDLGWPTRVTAAGGHYVDKVMENHDQINITVEFEKEHTMIVAGSTANELGLETVIRGHKGNLYVGGRNAVIRPERLFADEVEEQTFTGADIGDDQDLLRLKWVEGIRTREPVPSPVELGAKVMVIVDLATRSIWEGGAFSYDPGSRKVKKL
jgi:predicted dehydrogenase